MRGPEFDEEVLDVLVVGAGLSGIAAAHYLRRDCPWARFAVLEARATVGGTWDLFRYPGIRSDSDMFTLGYSFRPWRGEKAIAGGADILAYLEAVADEEALRDRIRFRHRVVAADWSSAEACWRVTVERERTTGAVGAPAVEVAVLRARFLFACTGYYRYDRGYLPDFPDQDAYAGPLLHPQAWPQDFEPRGKRVIVIGSGATAITLVPALAARGATVTMLQRSPTYVLTLPDTNALANALRSALPASLSGGLLRWGNALAAQGFYALSRRRPALARRLLLHAVRRALPPGYDVERHFTPRYDPWDQRLCIVTNGDLFRAICDGTVEIVTDRIERLTRTGIKLEGGRELGADAIVTATGLDLLFLGGIRLTVDGAAVDPAVRLAYRGMMLEGVPNLAVALGYTNASWTLRAELSCKYVMGLLQHMRQHGLAVCTPAPRAEGVDEAPLLSLSAGYVTRSADRFPKQGSCAPWQVHQSYLRDALSLRRARYEDGTLLFAPGASVAPRSG